jgi:hypothetical protein
LETSDEQSSEYDKDNSIEPSSENDIDGSIEQADFETPVEQSDGNDINNSIELTSNDNLQAPKEQASKNDVDISFEKKINNSFETPPGEKDTDNSIEHAGDNKDIPVEQDLQSENSAEQLKNTDNEEEAPMELGFSVQDTDKNNIRVKQDSDKATSPPEQEEIDLDDTLQVKLNNILEPKSRQNADQNTVLNKSFPQQEVYFDDKETSQEPKTYAKIIADYIFLLGRLTTKPITDFNGNVIIPRNTLVTAEIVLKAFYHGRLLELTKYSKA